MFEMRNPRPEIQALLSMLARPSCSLYNTRLSKANPATIGSNAKANRMATVGERIRRLRMELGWTQDELAQKAGISKSFLSDLENGKRSVGAETLLDLGRSLGVSLDYLMTGEGSGEQEEQARIPSALAHVAAEEGLSIRDTLALLKMREQITATRREVSRRSDQVNWREFYEAVKKFL